MQRHTLTQLWARMYLLVPYGFFLILLSVTLSIGLALSVFGFDTAFQRSGAVLVCFTILSLAANNDIKWELDERARIEQNLPEEKTSYDFKKEMIQIQKNEFYMGCLGTLIWAFGDLPFVN